MLCLNKEKYNFIYLSFIWNYNWYYQLFQSNICEKYELADGLGKLKFDSWSKGIGRGINNVMLHGKAIEKAAVNFSSVSEKQSFTEMRGFFVFMKNTKKMIAFGSPEVIPMEETSSLHNIKPLFCSFFC